MHQHHAEVARKTTTPTPTQRDRCTARPPRTLPSAPARPSPLHSGAGGAPTLQVLLAGLGLLLLLLVRGVLLHLVDHPAARVLLAARRRELAARVVGAAARVALVV